MANYTYDAFETSDLRNFGQLIEDGCNGGRGRVVSSNAYFDSERGVTMFYAILQIFDYSSDNPDYQMVSELSDISSNTSNIS